MNCSLTWQELDHTRWLRYFDQIRRTTLLQSCDYARTMVKCNHQMFKIFLIKIDDCNSGVVLICEAGALKNALHAVSLDRGPLWFEGFGSAEHIQAFTAEFSRRYPRRIGRKRRFIPEINSSAASYIIKNSDFKLRPGAGYQTSWLDLTQDIEDLRAGLKKNWRGSLKKAENSDLQVEWDDGGRYLPWFMQGYQADKDRRVYSGPDVKLLNMLAQSFAQKKNALIGRALINGKPIAGILVLCHGLAATYQAGWTTNQGRDMSAHHLLLWEAITILKSKTIQDLDLGGMNETSASGIKKFKEGLGGTHSALPGLFA